MSNNRCVNCLIQWKLWIRPLAVVCYAVAVLVFVPLFLVRSFENGFDRSDQLIWIAGAFAWLAIPISLWEIIQHVIHYTQPKLQKHIIRILWMVPIYAINAWLVLIYPKHAILMDSARECYEAYVIYNFMKFLLNYLNMEMDLEMNLEVKPQVNHIFPLCFLPNWEMGSEFVHICKHGILQYTVVRPVTSVISVICKLSHVYGDGVFQANVAFPYLIALNNLSQFVAMYCLVLFYKATATELRPMKPFPKFLCIKAVVFFSFFQGVLIDFLVYSGAIVHSPSEDGLSISKTLQNFIICIEMCMAAVAHHYSFSYKAYVTEEEPQQNCCRAFLAMWDVSDVQHDIQEHLGIVGSSISRRIRGRNMYSIARGSDEYSNLVPRTFSAPASSSDDLYQNYDDQVIVHYGTVQTESIPKSASTNTIRNSKFPHL